MMNPDFGSSVEHEFCLPSVFGCTDDAACNYNDDANMDNGTCSPGEPCSDGDDETILDAIALQLCRNSSVYGCTDPDACNYDIALGANVDDGSCYEMGAGNISGSIFPFAGGEFDYAYNGLEGTTLVWSVEGGEIISGQGTAEVRVLWGTEEEFGAVYVSETDNAGCEGQAFRTVQILDVADIAEASHAHATLMPNPRGELHCIGLDCQTRLRKLS